MSELSRRSFWTDNIRKCLPYFNPPPSVPEASNTQHKLDRSKISGSNNKQFRSTKGNSSLLNGSFNYSDGWWEERYFFKIFKKGTHLGNSINKIINSVKSSNEGKNVQECVPGASTHDRARESINDELLTTLPSNPVLIYRISPGLSVSLDYRSFFPHDIKWHS